MNKVLFLLVLVPALLFTAGCKRKGCTDSTATNYDEDAKKDDGSCEYSTATLHAAFSAFDNDNCTIYADGSEIVIEANGHTNHTSPYWSETHALYVAPTVAQNIAPGAIDDWTGTFTLRVSGSPEKASSSSATPLGPIGIAVTGSMIYNDNEGNNAPIDDALVSLDYTGAHTGPISYHYHLEPVAWSDDDDALIGVMADGFFLYGRKCSSTSAYPTDLDASGGHTSTTQHATEAEYHYHIQNELYLNEYYILFPDDYQGTANQISF